MSRTKKKTSVTCQRGMLKNRTIFDGHNEDTHLFQIDNTKKDKQDVQPFLHNNEHYPVSGRFFFKLI